MHQVERLLCIPTRYFMLDQSRVAKFGVHVVEALPFFFSNRSFNCGSGLECLDPFLALLLFLLCSGDKSPQSSCRSKSQGDHPPLSFRQQRRDSGRQDGIGSILCKQERNATRFFTSSFPSPLFIPLFPLDPRPPLSFVARIRHRHVGLADGTVPDGIDACRIGDPRSLLRFLEGIRKPPLFDPPWCFGGNDQSPLWCVYPSH